MNKDNSLFDVHFNTSRYTMLTLFSTFYHTLSLS